MNDERWLPYDGQPSRITASPWVADSPWVFVFIAAANPLMHLYLHCEGERCPVCWAITETRLQRLELDRWADDGGPSP